LDAGYAAITHGVWNLLKSRTTAIDPGELGIRIVILRAIAAFWLWYWPLNEPILAQNTVGEEVSALAT